MARVSEHDCFGDLSLLFSAPRSASVVADSNETALVRICRDDYDALVRSAAMESVSARARFIASIPMFEQVRLSLLTSLVVFLRHETHEPGGVVLPDGSPREDDVVIVESGELEVTRRPHRGRQPVRLLTLGTGSTFGALALPDAVQRVLLPALVAGGGGCQLLRLRRSEFEYRAGRRMLSLVATREAKAWMARLAQPGPFRTEPVQPAATEQGGRARARAGVAGGGLKPLDPRRPQPAVTPTADHRHATAWLEAQAEAHAVRSRGLALPLGRTHRA